MRQFEHAPVHAHHGVRIGAGGPHFEILALAENPLGGGAAMAIEAADEEDVLWAAGWDMENFGYLNDVSTRRQLPESTIDALDQRRPLLSRAHARPQSPAPHAVQGAERHLRNIRQLTHGGENAEAYFSPDGTHLIFQSTRDG